MASSSFWISIQCSPPLLWRSIWCNLLFVVYLLRPMNCGFMIKIIYEQYLNLLWILLCMIGYLCKSLRIISLVWPTRLIFLAMGEVLSFGFNLAVSFPSDSRGSKARIVLLPSRITRWGLYHIAWVYPSNHVILLNALLFSYELNTLDAGRSRSMCGVIVVDAGRSRCTCRGRDAYIHDHA